MSFRNFYNSASVCDFSGGVDIESGDSKFKVNITTGDSLSDLAAVTVIAAGVIVALDIVCNGSKLTTRVLGEILK